MDGGMNGSMVRIAHLLSYYLDGGTQHWVCQNDLINQFCRGHYGDSEWIIVDVDFDFETQQWVLRHAA
jgi:hypothetical protein